MNAKHPSKRSSARRRVGAAIVIFVAGLLASACLGPAGNDARPASVLVISIDTCRADHLSVYGYSRSTSPFLEEFAARSVVFENAFSQAPDTTPSHATLLTSRYPFAHGAANGVPLRDEFVTLAETLAGRGFRTAGFVSGWTMTKESSGLDQGFELYDDELTHQGMRHFKFANERPAELTTDRALEWLDANGNEPYFMFVHYFDPHGRYAPPAPYDTMFPPTDLGRIVLPIDAIPPYARIDDETDAAVYISMYDGEIRYVDDQIRRIVERLESRGDLDETLIVVTADHGESLTEHGVYFAHGWRLFDPSIHVPLIVSYPKQLPAGERVDAIVQTVDVMPTILDLLDLDGDGPLDGWSLLPLILEGEDHATDFAAATTTKSLTYLNVGAESSTHDHFAFRTADWKYLMPDDGKGSILFDLSNDPGETVDVSATFTGETSELGLRLAELLEEYRIDAGQPVEKMSEEERRSLEERLRSLGYIK